MLNIIALAVAALISCYAREALACHIKTPIEALFRPFFRGPATLTMAGSASAKQFAGRTALASGTASKTVSTAVVNSDSIITLALEVSSTSVASGGVPTYLVVNSIVSSVSFAITTQDGIGRSGGTIMWELRRTS